MPLYSHAGVCHRESSVAYTGSLPVGKRRQPIAVAVYLVDIPACSITTDCFRKLSGSGGIEEKNYCIR